MTPAPPPCSQMALSPLRARPCASVHPSATDSTVLHSLAPSATDGDPAFALRLALAPAVASRRDPPPEPIERRPPIQSP
jgi:hypothetical protein